MQPIIIALTTPDREEELMRYTLPGFFLAPTGASTGMHVSSEIKNQIDMLLTAIDGLLDQEQVSTPLTSVKIRLRISRAIMMTETETEALVISIPVNGLPGFPEVAQVTSPTTQTNPLLHVPVPLSNTLSQPEANSPDLGEKPLGEKDPPTEAERSAELLKGICELTIND